MTGPHCHNGCIGGFMWILLAIVGLATVLIAMVLASSVHAGVRMKASMYSEGQLTATGRRFNPKGLTAAHRTLPIGTKLTVRHAHRAIVVVINDRGPYHPGRELDLSAGAAKALDFSGVGLVVADRWPPLPRAKPW